MAEGDGQGNDGVGSLPAPSRDRARGIAAPAPEGPALAAAGLSARDLPALAAMAIAGVALAGWAAGLPILTGYVPGGPVMKANSAIAILLLGGACLLARPGAARANPARIASAALALSVLLLAGATAYEYLSGGSLGIDQLVARDASGSAGIPGRMAINTLASLVLIAAAILALDWAPRLVRPAEWLAAAVAVLALLALIGDAFGVRQFAGLAGDTATMAANTAVAFLLLISAVVAARPNHLIFRALSGRDRGSVFLRRFAPIAIATPFVFGVGLVAAVHAGAFPIDFGLSLATLLGMAIALAGVLATATYVRQAELEAIARREAGLFKALVDTAYEGVWTTDENGRTSFMNERMLEMLGYQAAELIGKPALPLAHPDYRARAGDRMKARLTGDREAYEGAFVRKDGSTLYALVSASPNYDATGRSVGSLAMVTDITARRAAAEVLRLSELRFRALFERAGVGIAVIDPSGRLLECNAALHRMLGYAEGELDGQQQVVMARPDDRAASDALFNRLAREQSDYTARTRYRRKDGSDLEVQTIVTRLEDGAGGWFALAVVQDLTFVVRGEEALRESERKSRFLATISHELRTPLNGILGFAQLLQLPGADSLTERQRHYVENIRVSGLGLLGMVSDVLDLTKAATGTLAVGSEPVNVSDAVRECMLQVGPLAAAKAIELCVEVAPALAVHADPLRFRQALLNLLSNALKFTLKGSVTVQALRDGEFIDISVLDTGIGIRPAALDSVFDEFFQVEDGSTRSAGGAGLGLPLTRRLMELMGGTIHAVSEPGVGSRFTIRLPAA